MQPHPTPGGFAHATDLTEFLASSWQVDIGGACYPEGHLESTSLEDDLKWTRVKVEKGAKFLISQLFFDNKHYFDFVARARKAGIDVPIVPGIMPITNVAQIERFTKMCGAKIPQELADRLHRVEADPALVMATGIEHAIKQCRRLLEGAVIVLIQAACAIAFACGLGSQDGVEALAKQLKNPDVAVRRQAIEDLARLKTPEAWTLVVESLADPAALVADEAQLRLAELADAAVLKTLWGKAGLLAKDAVVQQRAAEAVGRMKIEIDATGLCKGFSARDPDTRRAVVHAVELLGDAGKLEKNSKRFVRQQLDLMFKNDKDPDVRAAAVPARHATEAFTVSDLFEMLAKKDAGVVRASATHTLAAFAIGQVPGLYSDTLEDEELCAVRAFVAVLHEHPTANSAVSLTRVLRRRQSLRLGWTILDLLQDWSGETERRDTPSWTEWALKLPDGWKPKKPAQTIEKKYVTKAEMLGQPVITDHLTILIDVTEWTGEKGGEGVSRKARVRSELGRMLGNLPEKSQFNLVMYASTVAAWEKGVVDATPANVKRALKAFDDCAATGAAHFLEAASVALSDDRIDTILVITDSAPAGAHHADLGLVLEEIAQRNRFQSVVIDAVMLRPDAEVAEQWKQVCFPWGGRVTTASQ